MSGWEREMDFGPGGSGRGGAGDGRIYVGNLPADVREKGLEELFVCRDAEDAVYGRNGYDYGESRLRVEFPSPSRGRGGGFGGGLRGRNGPPSRHGFFVYVVSYVLCSPCLGLPPSGSWQDLKDHMREAGDVCYADVQKDGMGIVEFLRQEDMEYALRKLDDTKFRSHEGETSYIRVCPERSTSYGYSRSRSGSRGRDSPYQSRGSPRYSSPFRPY
nr:serine/arginine-rich splicing factor 9 [Pelodiscus sinensis]|eukprot:XP_014432006.1 serine/arginine-rich splicing factor 9 [Pelodiscus sinensis]